MKQPIVTDTGPLNYLIQVEAIDLLPALFSRVLLSTGVLAELLHAGAPEMVGNWASHLPPWVEVSAVVEEHQLPDFQSLSATDLQVIALGLKEKAAALIDDLAARTAAKSVGVPVLGTLGFLELASAKGLLDLPDMLGRLRQTNIRLGAELYRAALERDALRQQS